MHCSGKAFSKLMRKHKGLLRIDLCSNADGMSGVLEMLPKGSAKAATALNLASSGVQSEAQQIPQPSTMFTNSLVPGPHAIRGHDSNVAVGDNPDLAAALAVSSRHAEEQKRSGSVILQRPTRKGLVPMFTPDGQQQHSVEPGKENSPIGNDLATQPKGMRKAQKAKVEGSKGPNTTKLAGKGLVGPSDVRGHSAACTAGFEFGKMARLQSQPTARLAHFAPAAEEDAVYLASGSDQAEISHAAAPSSSQHWQTGASQAYNPAHQIHAAGSASLRDWNGYGSQASSQSESLLLSSTSLKRPGTAGIAGSASSTVSYQEWNVIDGADRSRRQPGNAVDLASDSAYMSQAWREVEAAEDLGRQRAAADFGDALHQLGTPAAADYAESAAAGATHKAVASSAADVTEAAANRQLQQGRARPGSARPAGTRSERQHTGAAAQQRMSHSRAGLKAASIPSQAMFKTEANPSEGMSAGCNAKSYSVTAREGEGVSSSTDQAAAAMEAAKMNAWKAEVMCELEGLKCNLKGAAAGRCRYALTCCSSQARKERTSLLCMTTKETYSQAMFGYSLSLHPQHHQGRLLMVQRVCKSQLGLTCSYCAFCTFKSSCWP